MPFRSLQFDTAAGDADAWADALLEAGALSVDTSDPRAGTCEEVPLFGEPGEPGVEPWRVSRLVALFPEGADAMTAIGDAAASLGQPAPDCVLGQVADQDWVRATQAQFEPVPVVPGMWIVPTWAQPPEPGAINLRLDPGLAFGTGSHATTRLCLQWLASTLVPGESLLDYGCGSGILAIAAAKLGARNVAGTDVDPQAIDASIANARLNGVDARFVPPDALGTGRFDVVVANILANPLVLLAPALSARVRPGGRIALSGILESQAGTVCAAYEGWFNIAASGHADGWVILAGRRRAIP